MKRNPLTKWSSRLPRWTKATPSAPKLLKVAGVYATSALLLALVHQQLEVSPEDAAATTANIHWQKLLAEQAKPEVTLTLEDDQEFTGLAQVLTRKEQRQARRAARKARRVRHKKAVSQAIASALPVKSEHVLDSAARIALRAQLPKEARKYLGTPYVWSGRDSTGFDCSGFTSFVLRQAQVYIPGDSRYQARYGKHKALNEVEAGDLVFFSRHGKGGRITHVAMVVSNTSAGVHVIHATTQKGIMVQNISRSKYWKPKILFAKDVISTL